MAILLPLQHTWTNDKQSKLRQSRFNIMTPTFHMILPKAGMSVCAIVKEKTSLGATTRSCEHVHMSARILKSRSMSTFDLTLGVRPLKKAAVGGNEHVRSLFAVSAEA